MTLTQTEELRVRAIESKILEVQTALNNLASKKELKNLVAVLERELTDLRTELRTLELASINSGLSAHSIDPGAHAELDNRYAALSDIGSINIFLGDGSDGDITISAETVTLTRDMFYNNLTIAADGILATSNWKVFVKDSLIVRGQINNSGSNGGNASGASGGSAGPAAATNSVGIISSGTTGRAGQTGAGTASAAGAAIRGEGGSGGSGGAGGAGVSAAGPISTGITILTTKFRVFSTHPRSFSATIGSGQGGRGGSSGGGGGSGNTSGAGGGGGACGGFIYIVAGSITIETGGIIAANGGNGGNGSSPTTGANAMGGGGGGGAGGGGVVYIAYTSLTNNGSIEVNTGTPGNGATGLNGGGTGNSGTAGSIGVVILINLSTGVISSSR